ncbi:HAMP domain-containing sensor histidine kinase [Desulfococcaceae bacterium HSG8]|nr:HAMP domain-containing sensor histidine kinase [Desulfococcaceae bacterium HSG8]
MDTYFAPPERTEKKELVAEIKMVDKSPVISGFLHSIGGLLAILDKHRQIIALNDSFLKMIGINDPYAALGLRTGEALKCIHSGKNPGGCGTSKFCSTCGAAIAIVSSLKNNKPFERTCALTARRGERTVDIALSVRSQPIEIEGNIFLLLFLQDITAEQQRAALERTFFHDINNMLGGLLGASEMLCLENNHSNLVKIINKSSLRLKNELDIQKCLSQSETGAYHPLWQEIYDSQVVEELKTCFTSHSAAKNKTIEFPSNTPHIAVKTDMSLLLRILGNMLTNALEATEENGTVKLWVEHINSFLTFCIWNSMPISKDIAQRIFQRNFSTKKGAGRGIGTYSMKLFGEQILAGKVGFTTSKKEGTVFTLSLPI